MFVSITLFRREENVFFVVVVQAMPPRDLAHQNRKRYLFSGGKGVFLCSKKIFSGHTLRLSIMMYVEVNFMMYVEVNY
jgi:hypothetical protein